jgi:peptidoglycan hydrolase-like protein with peptidoglycan-binding domain
MLRKKQKALSCAGALAVATFVVVALFSTASVQAKKSSFSTRSLGGVSCSTAIDQLTTAKGTAKGTDMAAAYTLWLSGYITSKNISSGFYDVFPVLAPGMQLTQFFANICSSNTDAKLVEVVEGAVNTLISKGYALPGRVGSPKIVVISHDDGKVPVYKDFLVNMQKFLKRAGYRISADGRFGNRTRAAIADYKQKNKLSGPALPDASMLQAMVAK